MIWFQYVRHPSVSLGWSCLPQPWVAPMAIHGLIPLGSLMNKMISYKEILLIHRPRSGQTMNSPRCNRGFWKRLKLKPTLKGLNTMLKNKKRKINKKLFKIIGSIRHD
jgi:hypothetical protein